MGTVNATGSQSGSLLQTKSLIPTHKDDLIHRERLNSLLEDYDPSKLLL